MTAKSLDLGDKPEKKDTKATTTSAAETAPNPPSLDDVTAEEIRKTEAAAAQTIADDKPETKRATKSREKKKANFSAAVQKKGVLSASSGQVTATIDSNAVAVPVLRMSMIGWVGAAPLEVTADSISDIRKVLDELEKQAS